MKYNSRSSKALAAAHPELVAPMESWRASSDISKPHKHRYGAVSMVLAALPSPLEKIDNQMLVAAGTGLGRGAAYVKDALAAARAFLAWANRERLLPCGLNLKKLNPFSYRTVPLPDELRTEVDSILADYRPNGRPVMPKYARKCIDEVSAIYASIMEGDRSREIKSLADFTKKDLSDYQKRLQHKGNARNGKPLAAKTVYNKVEALCSLIKAAAEQERPGFTEEAVAGFKHVKVERKEQADRYRPREVVAKFFALDLEAVAKMDLPRRFIEIRDAAMVMCQYDPALRCEDVVRLTTKDILYAETTVGGLLPFFVVGGKGRPRDSKERLHFTPPAVQYLELYMKVRDEYCKAANIQVQLMRDRKCKEIKFLGIPVFISETGEGLSEDAYRDAFERRAARAGVELRDGESTHLLRHSRISHWVEDGLPIDVVKELARHRDIKQTMEYYHYRPERGRGQLETLYGRRSAVSPGDSLPGMRMIEYIIGLTMKSLGVSRTLAETQRIARELQAEADPSACLGEVYTVPEVCERLNRGRTQIYEMVKNNILKGRRLDNGKLAFPRDEIDRIASLRTAAEAHLALGLRARSRLHAMSKDGEIEAVDWCGEMRFSDRSIVDCAIRRNTHKISLGTRFKRPSLLQMGFGAAHADPKVEFGEISPAAFVNGASKDPKSAFKALGAP